MPVSFTYALEHYGQPPRRLCDECGARATKDRHHHDCSFAGWPPTVEGAEFRPTMGEYLKWRNEGRADLCLYCGVLPHRSWCNDAPGYSPLRRDTPSPWSDSPMETNVHSPITLSFTFSSQADFEQQLASLGFVRVGNPAQPKFTMTVTPPLRAPANMDEVGAAMAPKPKPQPAEAPGLKLVQSEPEGKELVPAAPQPIKRGRGRPRKGTEIVQAAQTEVQKTAAAQLPLPVAPPEAVVVATITDTTERLRAAGRAYAEKHGTGKLTEILQQFQVSRVTNVPAEQVDAFLEAIAL